MSGRRIPALGLLLIVAGVASMGVAYAIGPSQGVAWTNRADDSQGSVTMPGFRGGPGFGSVPFAGTAIGGHRAMDGHWTASAGDPAPGQTGFVAGTTADPRLVRIYAYANDTFVPSSVTVQAGETITFAVTSMGPVTHEFMVGPAADVAANKDGTPEIADIGMMQTKTLTYTFNGSGPFSYACHEPGHYEAGMHGTIVVQ